MSSLTASSLPNGTVLAGEPDYERIWLEGRHEAALMNGRQWCSVNEWGDDAEFPPTEYVRADLATAPSAVPAVEVVGLEWEHRPYAAMPWIASSKIGDYRIKENGTGAFLSRNGATLEFCPGVDAAKVAAQADFNARVTSCIATRIQASPVPAAPADERAMKDACEPWAFSSGPVPEWGNPLHGVFVSGMLYTERLLADLLNVKRYEAGDGSEYFDQDATTSMRNILTEAKLWDTDENEVIRPASPLPSGMIPSYYGEPISPTGDAADVDLYAPAETAPGSGELECLMKENARLREQVAQLSKPDYFWDYDDPETCYHDWSDALDVMPIGEVAHLLCGTTLPDIWVTTRVLTVDDEGSPDETKPACFDDEASAKACYEDSLAAARAAVSTGAGR